MGRYIHWSGLYRPLRIVAHLSSPIAMLPHDALPLDGILEYAAFRVGLPPVRQYIGPEGIRRSLPRLTDKDPANWILPVKRQKHKCDPDWYWSASWVEFSDGFEVDRTHWNRRFDGGAADLSRHLTFMGKSEKVTVSAGRYKSYHMPMCLMVARTAQWWCLGAVDGVAQLLSEIHQIGHKRSQGYGVVNRWEIWPARQDYSCWRDGRPMRALPDQEGDYRRGWQAIRAPHWHSSRRRLCILPDERVPGLRERNAPTARHLT